MNETEITTLCVRVNKLLNALEEYLTPEEFVDEVENYEEALIGAMIARGFLEETVSISAKTIPFIQATEVSLATALAKAEGSSDEIEDKEDDEDGR